MHALTSLLLASGAAHAGAAEGRVLFEHEWTVDDPLSAAGDGLGPLYNATSCAECHEQRGVGGAGDASHDVEMLPGRGMVSRLGTSEGYAAYRQAQFTPTHMPEFGCGTAMGRFLDQFEPRRRQTPALFGIGLLDAIDEQDLEAVRRAGEERGVSGRIARDAEGRPGKLGWKAQMATVDTFVQTACANELGLGTTDVAQLRDPTVPESEPVGPDLDPVQVADLVSFVVGLAPPERKVSPQATRGQQAFDDAGCTACHAERVGSVQGAWTDLLLHDMGHRLSDESGGYGVFESSHEGTALAEEWRTPPLWGLAATGPYLHDGRASTIEEAIDQHGGEAGPSRDRYADLDDDARGDLLAFLSSLGAAPIR